MKLFDAEKFRDKMESLLGGLYVQRLVDMTGCNRMTVSRWVNKFPGNPKKGPSKQYQELISQKIKEEFGETIRWGEFMTSENEENEITNYSILKHESFDPYEELLKAKKEINDLTNIIFAKDQEIIRLRSLLDKR